RKPTHTHHVHSMRLLPCSLFLFFFNVPAPPEIYTLSLHDALPISATSARPAARRSPASRYGSADGSPIPNQTFHQRARYARATSDRKSTRLNSSHVAISYAVFCLKKKKTPGAPRSRRNTTTTLWRT